MGKLIFHREAVKKVLEKHKEIVSRAAQTEIENLFVFDESSDNYTWLRFGWTTNGRLESITAFIRLINDKIYIEEDLTENGIANDLIEYGVFQKDIVLAFQQPEVRKYTEFALS